MDALRETYANLLAGSYDGVDRMVLNGFFRMGHAAGGFRVWWRALIGAEETLDNADWMRMAGRFSRRLHAWAMANGIPIKKACDRRAVSQPVLVQTDPIADDGRMQAFRPVEALFKGRHFDDRS